MDASSGSTRSSCIPRRSRCGCDWDEGGTMRKALLCGGVRTPIGKYGGALRGVGTEELAAKVLSALVERTGLDPARVDDVILGQCYPSGENPALGRLAALR